MSKLTRRKTALQRLQSQLEKGTKPLKVNGKTTNQTTPLSDSDRNRIQKQLEVLSQKII